MSLTKQDLEQIRGVVVDSISDAFEAIANPRFDNIEGRLDRIEGQLDGVEGRLTAVESTQHYHTQQLRELTDKVDVIDGRLQAIESDVKELYVMVKELQQGTAPAKYQNLTEKQAVLAVYKEAVKNFKAIQDIAGKLGVKLPSL